MTESVGSTGGPGPGGGTAGVSGGSRAGDVGSKPDGITGPEVDGITQDAESVSDIEAAAVGEAVVSGEAGVDSFTVDSAAPTGAPNDDEAKPGETDPVSEEPGVLGSIASWAKDTAIGYGTGAVNTVLDTANLVNKGVNAGLDLAGVDYRFKTDMHIDAQNDTQRHAQNAMTAATIATGVAGAVKSAPALARTLDNAVDGTTSALGYGSKAKPSDVAGAASGAGAAARLGDLTPSEITRIQAAADRLGTDLYVVGSAAKGTRRNVGADLPLAEFGGSKAGTRSDIDYAVKNGFDDLASTLDLPDLDPSWGVRGVDYLNLGNSPAIRFSPGGSPQLVSGGGRVNLN